MLDPKQNIEDVHNKIVNGIKEFVHAAGAKSVVLGLSGGIDSALVASLATEALGSDNVMGFIMPSEFSTVHSVQDAVDLAENLGIKYHIIPIASIYNRFMKELAPVFGPDNEWNVAEENLQARIRGTLLMAYANKFGALALNTSNKSEICCGYGTLYGDLAGAAMIIADLYKVEVYEMAHYVNSLKRVIPDSTLTKAPSAELREGQKDSDSLPDYPLLDSILYSINEEQMSYEQLLDKGIDKAVLDKVLRLMKASSFKMCQLPPMFNVSKHPLGYREKWALKQ